MRNYKLKNDVSPALKYTVPNNTNNDLYFNISDDSLNLPDNEICAISSPEIL